MSFAPIGYFRTASGPRSERDGWDGKRFDIILNEALAGDLHEIAAFSRVLVAYDGGEEIPEKVEPILCTRRRVGLISPEWQAREPQPVTQIATVRLIAARGNTVTVEGINVADGTFVYDIKPCSERRAAPGAAPDWTTGLLRDTH